MHGERRLVGVGDGLVGLDQDHSLAQAGDDLPEFMPVDIRRHARIALSHPELPRWQRGTNGLPRKPVSVGWLVIRDHENDTARPNLVFTAWKAAS